MAPCGGNGGFAEVSGKQSLEFNGTANLTAPHGIWGTLLLDPSDITIDGSNDAPADYSSNYLASDDPGVPETIGSQQIVSLLQTGNVSLAAANTITQAADGGIDVHATGASGASLTLDAGVSITLNAAIATNNGGINLHTTSGDITLASGSTLNAGNFLVTINAGGAIVNGGNTNTIVTGGSAILTAGTSIGAAGSGNTVTTAIGSLSATASNGGVFVDNVGGLTLGNIAALGASGTVDVTNIGDLTIQSVQGRRGRELAGTRGDPRRRRGYRYHQFRRCCGSQW